MDAVEFLRERRRMCNAQDDCDTCPICIVCADYFVNHNYSQEKASGMVSTVEQWAKEHPIKTRQSVFLKMLPNVPLNDKGQPAFCPKLLDTEYHPVGSCCLDVDICQRCMDNFWGQEVEDA